QVFGIISGLKQPGRREILYVTRVDLIESTVAPGELRAAVMRPIGPRSAIFLSINGKSHKQNQEESHREFIHRFFPISNSTLIRAEKLHMIAPHARRATSTGYLAYIRIGSVDLATNARDVVRFDAVNAAGSVGPDDRRNSGAAYYRLTFRI